MTSMRAWLMIMYAVEYSLSSQMTRQSSVTTLDKYMQRYAVDRMMGGFLLGGVRALV